MTFLTSKIVRLAALLALPMLALSAGAALLAPAEVTGYECLVVPLGANQPEWTLDVTRGVTAWDHRAMGAPFRYVQSVSPNGRYQIVRLQRVIGSTFENLGWFLEDAWTGARFTLEHSAGFDAWSSDSRVLAYVNEPSETPRRLTLLEPETGAQHSQPLSPDEYIEGLSADGRYLLLQNSLSFERRIVHTADFSDALRAGENQQWLSAPWPPAGNRLVLLANGAPTLFDLDDDSAVTLAGLPADAITRNILWSPDGQRFAIVSMLSDTGFGLNLFAADGALLAEPIVAPGVPVPLPQFGAWSADGARFGFIRDDSFQALDAVSGALETLVSGAERMGMTWTYPTSAAAFLPLVHLEENGLALTVIDIRSMRVAGKLIAGAARIDLPFWSADASRVAVKWDDAGGVTRLSWANSSDFVARDLNEPGQLYSEDNPLDTTARWIDNGTTLLYSAYRSDESGIYVANVDSGESHRVTGDLDWDNPMITLARSPDGGRYAMSYRPQSLNGPSAFVLFTLDGRFSAPLPTSSYVMPVWSPDGARLAHWDTSSSAIYVFDASGATVLHTSTAPPNGGFEWTACGQRLAR